MTRGSSSFLSHYYYEVQFKLRFGAELISARYQFPAAHAHRLRHRPRMADRVLIPFNGSMLALTIEQLAEAEQAALELSLCAAKAAGDRVGLNPELLTADQLEARTSVPASWWEQAARENRVPHTQIGRYVRFEFAAVAEHFRCRLEPSRLETLRDWRGSRD